MTTKIINFGCRLNSFEADIIKQNTQLANLDSGKHEVVIFNSCSVTKEAIRQTKQAIRKSARENPQAKIILTGCAAHTSKEIFEQMDEIDFIIGNNEKIEKVTFDKIHDELEIQGKDHDGKKLFFSDIYNPAITNQAKPLYSIVKLKEKRARYNVQIQNGCDHNCTFCVIPFGRGRSRSSPIENVIEQIKVILDQGCQEIVLTGVDLTSYGADLKPKQNLTQLISTILTKVPQLKRLRLSSIDSIEIDDELFAILSSERRILPYLHLSLQSGNNLILKRMKRRHQREHAIEFCTKLLARRPEIVFGADLIAGFPTETEEMFQDTIDIIEQCQLTFLHIFPFSAHNIVPAARMPQVAKNIIKERAKILRQIGDKRIEAHLKSQIGRQVNILVETESLGKTDDYSQVYLDKVNNYAIGSVINSTIKDYRDMKLVI